jgi:ABC-type Zn uptake system ZnuABC Zn-binding protein ZnuA
MMKTRRDLTLRFGLLISAIFVFSSCGSFIEVDQPSEGGKIHVVATTTFIGDVVENIAGDSIDLTRLLEVGQNPHSYQPSPMDMVAVTEADLILVNGFGLEEFLDAMLSGSDTNAKVIVVSEGISPVELEHHHDEVSDDLASDDSLEVELGQDPHVWFDPNNILIWAENITRVLVQEDPANESLYQANFERYQEQLLDLDLWIREQISKIPEDQRELVTDHTSLGYFAQEYGLIQIGAVIPALTTEAETSGMELAALIDSIRENQARAIFVGVDFDPSLAQRVADDTGVKLVSLYFGSLSDGEPAGTYFSFMRYNVSAIVEALQ